METEVLNTTVSKRKLHVLHQTSARATFLDLSAALDSSALSHNAVHVCGVVLCLLGAILRIRFPILRTPRDTVAIDSCDVVDAVGWLYQYSSFDLSLSLSPSLSLAVCFSHDHGPSMLRSVSVGLSLLLYVSFASNERTDIADR